jgi:hypothetical protein
MAFESGLDLVWWLLFSSLRKMLLVAKPALSTDFTAVCPAASSIGDTTQKAAVVWLTRDGNMSCHRVTG